MLSSLKAYPKHAALLLSFQKGTKTFSTVIEKYNSNLPLGLEKQKSVTNQQTPMTEEGSEKTGKDDTLKKLRK